MSKKDKTGLFQRVDIQVTLFTAIVAIVSSTIVSVLYYNLTHYDMIRSMKDRVYSIQTFIENHVDTKAFTDINSPEDMNTALYESAHYAFKNAQDVTGVMYLYSGKKTESGELIYVVDCIDPSESDFRNPGDPIEEEIIPEMERALSGEAVMPHRIKKTEWGKIFIAYMPVTLNGEVVGVIGVEFEAEHQYNVYRFLLFMTPVVALIICIICSMIAKFLFRRISNPSYKDMSNTDYLTNLKSRNAFEVDIENLSARKKREGIGFYVIDLNNLKKVNDTLGHEAGDMYIQAAARSFAEEAGDNITIYRTGGDEFVMISMHDTVEKMELLEKDMLMRFDENKPEWDGDVELSFSIGYAIYEPDIDNELIDTYKRADRLMYTKKQEFHAKHK